MKLINYENNKSLIFSNARSPCAIILVNLKGPCIYLLMGFNDYLGQLVNMVGATSISTILLVDVDVRSFSPYIYLPTPWAKHTKTTVWGAPSLGNPSCSKLDSSHPSLTVAVAVAAALPSLAPRCPARHCAAASRPVGPAAKAVLDSPLHEQQQPPMAIAVLYVLLVMTMQG